MSRQTAAGAVVALALLPLLSSAAAAHVTLEVAEAPARSTYKAVLRVPHGCDGQPTESLRVEIPEGFIAAQPMPKPGWQLWTRTGAYAGGYDYYGEILAEGVTEIVWSGGSLPDAWYDEFVFRGYVADLPKHTALAFKTTQICLDTRRAWVEIAAPGQNPHDLENPAPVLMVAAAAADDHGGHGGHGMAAGGAATLGPIAVSDAYARASLGQVENSAAYMTLATTGAPDRLVRVASPAAGTVELHTHTMDDQGVMRMRPVAAIDVAPSAPTRLEPGGLHVMLIDLEQRLEDGQSIALTLTFEAAGEVTLTVPVRSLGNAGHAGHGTADTQ